MNEPDATPPSADPTIKALSPAEVEIGALTERLEQWETLFETTNPTQAKAELLAVQEKKFTAQKERAQATSIIIDLRIAMNAAEKQIASLKAELAVHESREED